MTDHGINDVTPDTLMHRFKGKGLKSIIVFTLVMHAVVLTASSVPYLVQKIFRADTSGMKKEERVKAAVAEASESIRKIAASYELTPQDISDQFAGSGSRAAAAATGAEAETPEAGTPEAGTPTAVTPGAETANAVTPAAGTPAAPARPQSAIEKELDVKAEGPAVPKIDDDIF